MRRDAHGLIAVAAGGLNQSLNDLQKAVRIVMEAALPALMRLTPEPAIGIKRRQAGDADAGSPGGGNRAQRHLADPVVRRAVRLIVQILKLAYCGEAGFEHFDVKLGCDGFEIIRTHLVEEPVHNLAPGPETVWSGAGAFRKSGHRALVGMGMDIRHAGQGDTLVPFGIG